MRGTITKKGRRYWVVVDVARDPETGRRKRQWHGSWTTRAEAEDALNDIVGRLRRGTYVAPTRLTVEEFITEKWLPAARGTLKPSTAKLYETIVYAYVIPRLGGVPLQSLSAADLNALYGELLRRGRKRADGGRGLSATSVRNVHRVVHRALRDAVRWDLIARNPAEVADPPRAGRPSMVTWSPVELRAFLEHTVEHELSALWLLLATTGLRRGEALALRWSDVDLNAGRLSVRQTLSYVGTRATFSDPKTARSRRSVPLPSETVDALRAHRSRQLEERLAFGPDYANLDLVFARADGSAYAPATVSRTFERLVAELALPHIGLHGLRHGFATMAISAGVHVKVVSEILGHTSTATTSDLYQHVVPSMAADATGRVARLVFEG